MGFRNLQEKLEKTYLSVLAKNSLKQAVFVHECAKDCSFFRSVTSILIVTDGVSKVMEFSDLAQFNLKLF